MGMPGGARRTGMVWSRAYHSSSPRVVFDDDPSPQSRSRCPTHALSGLEASDNSFAKNIFWVEKYFWVENIFEMISGFPYFVLVYRLVKDVPPRHAITNFIDHVGHALTEEANSKCCNFFRFTI